MTWYVEGLFALMAVFAVWALVDLVRGMAKEDRE